MEEEKSEIVVAPKAEIAKVETSKIPIKYKDGMVHLESVDEAFRFAKFVLNSSMCPATMKSEASIVVAMQYGSEVGLKPMQAIQNIAVINGKPGLYGKALPAVVQAAGVLESFVETLEGKPMTDEWTAVCSVVRKNGQDRTERFSWAQAKRAGLDKKPGPWQQYPDLMLRYRARGLAFNTLFADVLCGFEVAEVLMDYPRKTEFVEAKTDLILEGK